MYKIQEGIKYFDEPEVLLIASTMINQAVISRYMYDYCLLLEDIDFCSDFFLPEFAGRHCYMSFNNDQKTKGTENYIENSIIKKKHFSVLEHINYTFILRGVSRSFTHEIVRHRHLSVSQQSTRYIDENNFCFVKHPVDDFFSFILNCRNSIENYKCKFEKAIEFYNKEYGVCVRAKKSARGYARQYLPHNLEAPIILTGNYRTWIEILEKRYSNFAEEEMKVVAEKIKQMLPDLGTKEFKAD